MIDLNTIWFVLVGVLLGVYAVLDGFDLGVGVLHLFARDENVRRKNLNAIAPVWDGNEVWLLAGGGALFAAFPAVYATVFSGFYLAMVLVVVALIFRAVALEFRHHGPEGWQRLWDWAFGIGSLVAAILFGVAFGNILRGIPLDEHGNFIGTFPGLLNPYALLTGVLSLAMFVTQGALYMAVKSEGFLSERMTFVASAAWTVFAVVYAAATVASAYVSPFLFAHGVGRVLWWMLAAVLVASLTTTAVNLRRAKPLGALFGHSATILCMMGLTGVSIYPRFVPAINDLDLSLTVYNASSTSHTLGVMLAIALIGVPLILAYTVYVYWVFRGQAVDEAYGASEAAEEAESSRELLSRDELPAKDCP